MSSSTARTTRVPRAVPPVCREQCLRERGHRRVLAPAPDQTPVAGDPQRGSGGIKDAIQGGPPAGHTSHRRRGPAMGDQQGEILADERDPPSRRRHSSMPGAYIGAAVGVADDSIPGPGVAAPPSVRTPRIRLRRPKAWTPPLKAASTDGALARRPTARTASRKHRHRWCRVQVQFEQALVEREERDSRPRARNPGRGLPVEGQDRDEARGGTLANRGGQQPRGRTTGRLRSAHPLTPPAQP